jgi:DNA-binding NarL/FixJ family response regulator
MTVRLFVADDHPPVLDAISRYLADNGLDVVGTAGNGLEALAKIERARPAVAVVDSSMPGLDGVELTRRLGRIAPSTAVILYTGYGDQALLQDALDAGARGFVLKEAPLADLIRAIETTARGGVYVDSVLAGAVATRQSAPELTKREREVLRLLAEGCTNEQIGRELSISAETVRAHVAKASRKLGARTRTQAVATALRLSLIA